VAERKFKGKSRSAETTGSRIKSEAMPARLDRFLRFSFKFYDSTHKVFTCEDRSVDYFQKLLERIKDLSKERVDDLLVSRTNTTTRFHRIDFSEARVNAHGFGIAGWEDCDEEAWQFSLSSNEHGRVHGFLIENVFYVVWLDPKHQLYL
jgi:hypothetical protein